jgi:hypothetical protein
MTTFFSSWAAAALMMKQPAIIDAIILNIVLII